MMFLAFVKSVDKKTKHFSSGRHAILVEAEDKEGAKTKVEAHYLKEWPDQIIEDIQIGTTII